MLTVYELISFFQTGNHTETITLDWKGRRSAGEKMWCSHARANVVVCCLLFYKICITPRAYRRVFAGNCFQHFPLLLFCSQFPFSHFRSNTFAHTVIYPACSLLPFSGIISSEVLAKGCFWIPTPSSLILCSMLHFHHS